MTEPCRIQIVRWTEQRNQLLQIRFRVFVNEQGVPPEMEEDEYDPHALHLLAISPVGKPVGCARLYSLDQVGHIGRMAVLAEYRKQGIGMRLLRELLRQATRQGLHEVELHAQCAAEPFYAKAGFEPAGEVFMEAGIPHRTMRLDLRRATAT
jgi:predicted GNAT family N-acyltransferase